ncbi:MAG: NADH:flavin oxidoreductase [Desulfobacteraceae bacterium]|jgi:2,4-dienoyl-CoA reductase-like NADH-dependent reductase (Old Yellow Enzyme family)
MSILFTPAKLGDVLIKNRFIHSACEDNMATESGDVTDEIINKLQKLSRGEVGLIIWSHLWVHPSGRTKRYQAGIYEDDMIDGLSRAASVVHNENGKIAFQIGHGGLQARQKTTGQSLMGPASMTGSQIEEIINAFKSSAQRAIESGADAIQLHAAHGYLLNEFLSPHFNQREDEWGGSDENRFRILKEIILEIRSILPDGFPLLVKLNTNDYMGKEGIGPSLAIKYAEWLKELSIDGLETSCGTSLGSPFCMCRGDVPVDEMVKSFPASTQEKMKIYFKSLIGKFDLKTPYNIEATKYIRPVFGDIPLFAVGGWRDLNQMEDAVSNGDTDFISMCRPFIREPNLVKRFRKGKAVTALCKSCNKCLAALPNDFPVRCYYHGFPH